MKNRLIFLSILFISITAFASNQSYKDLNDEMDNSKESAPLVWLGVNAAPIGIGASAGAPIIPITAGIRIAGGLSIGPMLTFSGKYKYQETDLSLSGFGAQATYSFVNLRSPMVFS